MINQLVGLELWRAEEILKSQNIKYQIITCNDKKMNDFDKVLVLRATQNGEEITLVATKFLFSPSQQAKEPQ